MKTSNKKSIQFVPLRDNDPKVAIDFDYGELDNSPVFEGEFGACLKDAVNNYLRRRIFDMFRVFLVLTEEERKVIVGKEVFDHTFRELARQINRDHKTAQARYYSAMSAIHNSPLVNVDFERKSRED